MEKLSALRERWECGGDVILSVCTPGVQEYSMTSYGEVKTFSTIYVIVEFKNEVPRYSKYRLLRYFNLEEGWAVSCDVESNVLGHCLESINEAFVRYLPKGDE